MAIRISYEPFQAIGALSERAGRGEFMAREEAAQLDWARLQQQQQQAAADNALRQQQLASSNFHNSADRFAQQSARMLGMQHQGALATQEQEWRAGLEAFRANQAAQQQAKSFENQQALTGADNSFRFGMSQSAMADEEIARIKNMASTMDLGSEENVNAFRAWAGKVNSINKMEGDLVGAPPDRFAQEKFKAIDEARRLGFLSQAKPKPTTQEDIARRVTTHPDTPGVAWSIDSKGEAQAHPLPQPKPEKPDPLKGDPRDYFKGAEGAKHTAELANLAISQLIKEVGVDEKPDISLESVSKRAELILQLQKKLSGEEPIDNTPSPSRLLGAAGVGVMAGAQPQEANQPAVRDTKFGKAVVLPASEEAGRAVFDSLPPGAPFITPKGDLRFKAAPAPQPEPVPEGPQAQSVSPGMADSFMDFIATPAGTDNYVRTQRALFGTGQ